MNGRSRPHSVDARARERARVESNARRFVRASVRSHARRLSRRCRSFDAFDAFDAFARRERGGWERIGGSIERSNDERGGTNETSNGLNRERKERFDVDADEPEDAISRTHDAR
jgi:hypothetical protein